jgi:acetyl-CoA carboxylase biotin carboxylase subunit
VSELVTGIDVVREQIRIAAGSSWRRPGAPRRSGHAIEIRINAEDPHGASCRRRARHAVRAAARPGVRVDTAVAAARTIPPFYDSMIAKVIVSDDTRAAAIARAERALRELVVEGIPTTRELALDVLASAEFRSGAYSTSTLTELEGSLPSLVPA